MTPIGTGSTLFTIMRANMRAKAGFDREQEFKKFLELHKKYLSVSAPGLDYTVTRLAREIGVSRVTVFRWIRGTHMPYPKYRKKLRETLARLTSQSSPNA